MSTSIPYRPDAAWLEIFYGVIDICLLLGLIGISFAVADRIGKIGRAGFAIAIVGQASIVGPDPVAFGVDFYRAGSAVLLAGLAAASVTLLIRGRLRGAASCWLLSAALTFMALALRSAIFISAAGFAFAIGFVLAGRALTILHEPEPIAR